MGLPGDLREFGRPGGPHAEEPAPGWADGYAERSAEQIVTADAGGRPLLSSSETTGIAVRVISPGRRSFIQSGLHDPAQARDLAAAAVLPAAAVRRLERELAWAARLACAPPAPDWGWLGPARDLLETARTAALEAGAGQARARLWRRRRSQAMTGPGGRATQVISTVRLTVTAGAGPGQGSASVAGVPAAPLTAALAAAAGRRAAAQAAVLAAAVLPPSGPATVVFAPPAAALLIHEVIGHALEADTAPAAPLWRDRGSWRASAALTVADAPGDPWAWEQAEVDEEGTPCARAALITGGQVTGVLADRVWGERLGTASTGHARRGSYASPPVPRMRHTAALAGPDPAAGIIAGTRRGILIQAIDSGDAMPGQGRYSLRVREAREIVRGVPGQPLTGFTVTGGLDELALLDAVGDDPAASASLCGRQGRWLPVSHSAPTLRLPRLTVRGRPAGS